MWPLLHPRRFAQNTSKWVSNPTSEMEVVFIVGVPRSGTTLLKTLLVAHSDLAGTAYESSGLFRIRDFCSYHMGEFTREQLAEIMATHRPLVNVFEAISSELLERQQARLFVDKLTVQSWRLRFVAKHFPRAKFVLIVRDGRDCLCSARNHENVLQSETVRQFATYWNRCLKVTRKSVPEEQLHVLKYEALTDTPQDTLGSLMDFIGYPFQEEQLDPSIYQPSISRHSPNHKNLGGPISVSSIQRWRRDLDESSQQLFLDIAQDELTRYGYPID